MWTKGFDHKDGEWIHIFGHEIQSKQEIIKWFKVDANMFYLNLEGNVFAGMVGGAVKEIPQVMQHCSDIFLIDR